LAWWIDFDRSRKQRTQALLFEKRSKNFCKLTRNQTEKMFLLLFSKRSACTAHRYDNLAARQQQPGQCRHGVGTFRPKNSAAAAPAGWRRSSQGGYRA
jgi:hypothetical protein